MAIPDYETVMLPLLRLAANEAELRLREVVESLATEFMLSENERAEMLPSGTAPTFANRVGWARTYLSQAGLLKATRPGYFRITDAGKALLMLNPRRIDVALLEGYEAFRAFRARRRAARHVQMQPGV